jgi:hypothetical protein
MKYFESNHCLGIYLHSNRISKAWVQRIEDELPLSLDYINRFISITGSFSIYLFDDCYSKGLRKQYQLHQWAKAVALDSKILILSNFYSATNWKLILRHEIFHTGVYEYNKDNLLIPVWFNEAIAYYIGDNTNVETEDFKKIRLDISRIKKMLINDTLIQNSKNGYLVTKLLGKYLCTVYLSDDIKNFFRELKSNKDFEFCFVKTFGCTLADFINKWAYELSSTGIL